MKLCPLCRNEFAFFEGKLCPECFEQQRQFGEPVHPEPDPQATEPPIYSTSEDGPATYPGLLVVTKTGKTGRTFHRDERVNGKIPVYIAGQPPMLCRPETLRVRGYID